jgi:hypothetical protein
MRSLGRFSGASEEDETKQKKNIPAYRQMMDRV